MASQKIIRSLIFIGLWSILIIPFYVANSMFFPFITGKNFLFRIIVEIIFALWVYLAYIDAKFRPKFSWVLGTVIIFVAIMAIADAFAVAPIKSFFSNFERMARRIPAKRVYSPTQRQSVPGKPCLAEACR